LHKRNSADAVAVNQEAKATRPRSNAPSSCPGLTRASMSFRFSGMRRWI